MNTAQQITTLHYSPIYIHLPEYYGLVKGQAFGIQLQLWPDAPARQVDDHRLRVVFDFAHNTVLNLSQFGWVGPYSQFLAKKHNFMKDY